jgi:hypothetical protein
MIQFHFPVVDYLWKNALNTTFATWPNPDEEKKATENDKRSMSYPCPFGW